MDSNGFFFIKGLHVAQRGRGRDPSINWPRSFSTVSKNGKRKRALSLSPDMRPLFQCRFILGNGHFDQRLITVSCLALYCPLISLSVEDTSASCCLYNDGETCVSDAVPCSFKLTIRYVLVLDCSHVHSHNTLILMSYWQC